MRPCAADGSALLGDGPQEEDSTGSESGNLEALVVGGRLRGCLASSRWVALLAAGLALTVLVLAPQPLSGLGLPALAPALEAVGLSSGFSAGAAPPPPCSLTTVGSCRFTGRCDSSRGNTTCRSGRCVCAQGYCANSAGVCLWQGGGAVERPQAAPVLRTALGLHVVSRDMMCEDTPEWTDGWLHCGYEDGGAHPELCPPTPGASWPSTRGWTCQAYREKGWCSGGKGTSSMMGLLRNHPEGNCCACGGGRQIASRRATGELAAVRLLEGRCSRDTGGSCAWTKSCGRFRGPVACVSGKCLCQEGYCSDVAGTCHPKAPPAAPMASLVVRESLGLHREPGQAMCQDTPGWSDGWALCAYEAGGRRSDLCRPFPGLAWPSTAGWTCQAYAEKGWCRGRRVLDGHLGAFFPEQHCCACGGGKIVARGSSAAAVVANATQPKCYRDTGGTCRLLGQCRDFRGEASCESNRCICREGYCAHSDGACYRNFGLIAATVVPVHQQQPSFPERQAFIATGLCISGGGSRSAASALGVLRALHSLGLLPGVDAISAVSGGSWASAVFMFANLTLAELLGSRTDPSRLSLAALAAPPPALGFVATAATTRTALGLKAAGVPLGALWVSTVAKAILEPFGLGSLHMPMAPSSEAVASIRARNPQFREQAFLVPQPGRPRTFIIGGTVEAPDGYRASGDNAVSLQMSPDFSGTPFYPNNMTVSYESSLGPRRPPLKNVLLGGGLVETFAFGGEGPAVQPPNGGAVLLRAPVQVLSLARAVGISSAAFAGAVSQAGLLDSSAGATLSPHGNIWPVTSAQQPGPRQTITYQLGDGASIENTGLLALLQRRVPKIAMVINTDVPLSTDVDFCNVASDYDPSGTVSSALADKFGFPTVSSMSGLFWARNQVFSKSDFLPLLCELGTLRKAGRPLVSRHQLPVQPNAWWGISGGWTVDLLLVLLDRSPAFEAELPAETQAEVEKGTVGRFAHFPHFKTVLQTADLTALHVDQANLLAALMEYAVMENAQHFQDIFR